MFWKFYKNANFVGNYEECQAKATKFCLLLFFSLLWKTSNPWIKGNCRCLSQLSCCYHWCIDYHMKYCHRYQIFNNLLNTSTLSRIKVANGKHEELTWLRFIVIFITALMILILFLNRGSFWINVPFLLFNLNLLFILVVAMSCKH